MGDGVKGEGGRGHFIHLAIHCTATWCFALKGLRTMKGSLQCVRPSHIDKYGYVLLAEGTPKMDVGSFLSPASGGRAGPPPSRKMSGSIDVVASRRIMTVGSAPTPNITDFVEGTEDIKEEPD